VLTPQDQATLQSLHELADGVVETAERRKVPHLDIPSRSLSNVQYNRSKRFIEMGSGKNRRELFNLSLAKNQSLSLNPSQISGGCGRLLCCLKYEHEFYVTSRKRFPREGKTVETLRGTEKVIAVDIFRERVYLRGADESRTIGLEELREEMEGASGGAVIVAPPARRTERPEPRSRPERTERSRPERPERSASDRPRTERPPRQEQRAQPVVPALPPPESPVEATAPDGSAPSPKKRRRRRRRRGGGGGAGENTNPSGPASE
jgi:hypothetical protein